MFIDIMQRNTLNAGEADCRQGGRSLSCSLNLSEKDRFEAEA